MRALSLLALAGILALAPLASAAVPWQHTFPSCSDDSALTVVACENTREEGTNCPGTYVLEGTFGGTRCDLGYGTYQTCITAGVLIQLVYWCQAKDIYGRYTTTLGVEGGAFTWRSTSPGTCSMSVANTYATGCPAGAPPNPEMVPLAWGYVLP